MKRASSTPLKTLIVSRQQSEGQVDLSEIKNASAIGAKAIEKREKKIDYSIPIQVAGMAIDSKS